jgi:hypothetical protein
MDVESCTVQVGLLFICVDVVCAILSQGVELPRVVKLRNQVVSSLI